MSTISQQQQQQQQRDDKEGHYTDIRCWGGGGDETVNFIKLGWTGGVLQEEIIRAPAPQPPPQRTQHEDKLHKRLKQHTEEEPRVSKMNRVTITVNTKKDLTGIFRMAEEYKIVALRPTSVDAMRWAVEACIAGNADMISVDLSTTSDIVPRLPDIKALSKAGMFLEISISDLFIKADTMALYYNRILTAKSLLKVARRLVIISTGATDMNELRSLHEVHRVCQTLLGMREDDVIAATSSRVKDLFSKAARRRSAAGFAV